MRSPVDIHLASQSSRSRQRRRGAGSGATRRNAAAYCPRAQSRSSSTPRRASPRTPAGRACACPCSRQNDSRERLFRRFCLTPRAAPDDCSSALIFRMFPSRCPCRQRHPQPTHRTLSSSDRAGGNSWTTSTRSDAHASRESATRLASAPCPRNVSDPPELLHAARGARYAATVALLGSLGAETWTLTTPATDGKGKSADLRLGACGWLD